MTFKSSGQNVLLALTIALQIQVYHKYSQNREAVAELLKELEIYTSNNYSTTETPQATYVWEVHNVLGQVYSVLDQAENEIEHYEAAIKILMASTKVPPEVYTTYALLHKSKS